MALILLILIGAIIGWLETVRAHVERPRSILGHCAWGVGGAVMVGVWANDYSFLAGLGLFGLLGGIGGALVAMGLYALFMRRAQAG